jgi:hypothetical protein
MTEERLRMIYWLNGIGNGFILGIIACWCLGLHL